MVVSGTIEVNFNQDMDMEIPPTQRIFLKQNFLKGLSFNFIVASEASDSIYTIDIE